MSQQDPRVGDSAEIDFAGIARDCLKETDRLVRTHGPRLAGSEASKTVAYELAEDLCSFCDHVRVEEFAAHPASFYSYTKLLPIAYTLGILSLFVIHGLYLVPIVGIAVGVALMCSQFWFYSHIGDCLFPPKACFNVDGTIEPAGEAQIELIISGHHDSAPIARIFSGPFHHFYAVAIIAPYAFYFLELGLLGGMLWDDARSLPLWAAPAILAGLPFVLGYFFLVDLRQGSPGAGDNLVASVLTAKIAKEFAARRSSLLRRTRVHVVSFDAEEAGLRGSAAYMKTHRAELNERPVFMLNFDSLYDVEHLHVLLSDVNGTIHLSHNMAEDIIECLRMEGCKPRPFHLIFGAGGTDAAEAARAGIEATTVIAISTAVVREKLAYHTPRDTVGAIDIEAVEACLRLIVRYLALLESGQAHGL
jgi:aminopeptidase YwaD